LSHHLLNPNIVTIFDVHGGPPVGHERGLPTSRFSPSSQLSLQLVLSLWKMNTWKGEFSQLAMSLSLSLSVSPGVAANRRERRTVEKERIRAKMD
jgi:hypothetical protein